MRRNGSEVRGEPVGDGTKITSSSVREVTRITVSLALAAAADLRRAIARSHLSQTDIVNRAISLYEYIDSELADGAELIIRKNGQDHVVKIL